MAKGLRQTPQRLKKPVVARKTRPTGAKKEHTEQAAFVTRMSFEFKDVLGFGVPNGAKRSAWESAQHAAEGLTSGIPDFYIEEARGGWFGLRLEFKKPSLKPKTDRAIAGGRSKTQISIHERLTAAGYLVFTVYSCEEAMTRVYAYMAKPRTIGLCGGV